MASVLMLPRVRFPQTLEAGSRAEPRARPCDPEPGRWPGSASEGEDRGPAPCPGACSVPGGGRTSGLQGEPCAVVARAPGGTRRACGVRAAGPAAGLPASGPPAPWPGRGARLSVRPVALRGGRRSASGEARGNAVLTARTAPGGSALSSREPRPSWGSVCLTVSVARTRPCAAGSSALQTAPSVLWSVCHGPTRRQPHSDT